MLPGCYYDGFRRLPCLQCQPRSTTRGRCKREALSKLGKSDPFLTINITAYALPPFCGNAGSRSLPHLYSMRRAYQRGGTSLGVSSAGIPTRRRIPRAATTSSKPASHTHPAGSLGMRLSGGGGGDLPGLPSFQCEPGFAEGGCSKIEMRGKSDTIPQHLKR